jgi:hypothetical protein
MVTMRVVFPVLILLVLPWELAANPPIRADFFVATNGSNANPGTLDKPFATLAAARDAVRQLKAAGALEREVTVLVRGGIYVFERTLVFGPEDSGTLEHPIVYAAYPGQTPILSSGRKITGWKRGEGQRWIAEVPDAKGAGAGRFTQLFVNGTRQTRARLPDTDDWRQWWRVDDGPNHPSTFKFPKDTLRKWSSVQDLDLNILAQYYWFNQIMPLKAVDESSRTATLAAPLPIYYTICPGNPFRVENVPEGVNRPGTWCVNTQSGTVTLWLHDGTDPSQSVVTTPTLPALIRCEGDETGPRLVRGLTFRGLTFTQTAQVPQPQRDSKDIAFREAPASALLLQGAEGCAVENCRFIESGEYGVRLNLTAKGNRIIGNEFAGCGAGGIRLTGYGPGTKDVNNSNTISNNHIHHCSLFHWHASAIYGSQSGQNTITFNRIHHMPYAGIHFADAAADYFKEYRGKSESPGFNFRWDEIDAADPLTRQSVKRFTHSRKNVIAYNAIQHVMERLEDGGGVYLAFDGGQNVVRANLIDAVHGARMSVGIYMDAESDRELIEHNVVWDCDTPQFDNGEEGPNNNTWDKNVMCARKEEPPEARALRETIAAKLKESTSAGHISSHSP